MNEQSHAYYHAREVLFENDVIRVSRISVEPGASMELPDLKNYYFYFLGAGDLKATYPSGEVVRHTPFVGEQGWIDTEQAHLNENIGSEPMVYLTVESK